MKLKGFYCAFSLALRCCFSVQRPWLLMDWENTREPQAQSGVFRVPKSDQKAHKKSRKVLNGVGADGVGVKVPMFAVNWSRLPLSSRRTREKQRKKEEKQRKAKKKSKEKQKKGETSSDPIYTDSFENLPTRVKHRSFWLICWLLLTSLGLFLTLPTWHFRIFSGLGHEEPEWRCRLLQPWAGLFMIPLVHLTPICREMKTLQTVSCWRAVVLMARGVFLGGQAKPLATCES